MSVSYGFTKELLEDLYINQKLSTVEIAKKLNCRYITVEKYLKQYNILLRYDRKTKYACIITKTVLEEYYTNQKLSLEECARRLNSNPITVKNYLKKYTIPIRIKKITLDRDILQEYYITQGLSVEECSKLLDCSISTVLRSMNKYNILVRDRKIELDRDILYEYYINQKLSSNSIALLLNCGSGLIIRQLKKYNITIRSDSEAHKGIPSGMKGKHHTEESKKKSSEIHKLLYSGENHPFYGKHHTEESKKLMSNNRKGKALPEEHIKNISKGHILLWQNPEYREKQSNGRRKKWKDPEYRNNYINMIKEKWKDPEYRKKQEIAAKKNWEDPEYIEKMRKVFNISPNKEEKVLLNTLNYLYPGMFRFVGNFSYWVNKKNPDFICESQKLIIEYNGYIWHKNDIPGEREEIFAKGGWSTLIIWDYELKNLDEVIYKIKKFVEI